MTVTDSPGELIETLRPAGWVRNDSGQTPTADSTCSVLAMALLLPHRNGPFSPDGDSRAFRPTRQFPWRA